jgi:hypothetical protein
MCTRRPGFCIISCAACEIPFLQAAEFWPHIKLVARYVQQGASQLSHDDESVREARSFELGYIPPSVLKNQNVHRSGVAASFFFKYVL